jgi:hypothetical protein
MTTLAKRRGHEVEQPGDDGRIEVVVLAEPAARRQQRQGGGILRQHDVEQMIVEALGVRDDVVELQGGLEVEVFGAHAGGEVEVDEAGRGLAPGPALAEQKGRVDRERGGPDAAHGAHEGEAVDLDAGAAGGRQVDAAAGLDQFARVGGLAQPVGDAQAQEQPHHGLVDVGRDDDEGGGVRFGLDQLLQRGKLRRLGGVELHRDEVGRALALQLAERRLGRDVLDLEGRELLLAEIELERLRRARVPADEQQDRLGGGGTLTKHLQHEVSRSDRS